MKSLAEQLDSYSAYHRNPTNIRMHFFGVPMVTVSMFIFLGWFRFIYSNLPITGATLSFVMVGIYYLLLDFQVGAITLICFLPLLILSHFLSGMGGLVSLGWFLFFFVGGWIIQLWGHYYEGRRPALTDNLMQIFNAPLFLVCEVLFKFHKREDLKSGLQNERSAVQS